MGITLSELLPDVFVEVSEEYTIFASLQKVEYSSRRTHRELASLYLNSLYLNSLYLNKSGDNGMGTTLRNTQWAPPGKYLPVCFYALGVRQRHPCH